MRVRFRLSIVILMVKAGFSTINTIHVKVEASPKNFAAEVIGSTLIQEAVEVKILQHIWILKGTEVEVEGLAVPNKIVDEGVRCVCRLHLLDRL